MKDEQNQGAGLRESNQQPITNNQQLTPPLEILRHWYLYKATAGQSLNRGELLALLADWHELSGEWLSPPNSAYLSTGTYPYEYFEAGRPAGRPCENASIPGGSRTAPTNSPNPRPLSPVPHLIPLDLWDSPRHDYQPPMPGMARPVLLRQSAPTATRATGYNYQESLYRRAAEQLLERVAGVSPWLREGCAKTLTVVLAWCNHPLFLAMGGGWMTLGSKRFCRELGVKNELLQVYIAELQRLGLVMPGFARERESSLYPEVHLITAEVYATLKGHLSSLPARQGGGPGGYLNPRAVQSGNTFYKLKEGIVSPILPEFNPFEDSSKPVEAPQGYLKALPKYPPGSQYKAIKLGGGEKLSKKPISIQANRAKKVQPLNGLTKQQLENERKEKFLTGFHAQFAPFKFDPLHPSVIEEFVANYNLPTLLAKYRQLRDDWQEGRANFTNPVGIYVSRVRDTANATYRLAPEQEQAIRAELARRRGQHKQSHPPKTPRPAATTTAKTRSGGIDFSKYTQPGGKYYHLTDEARTNEAGMKDEKMQKQELRSKEQEGVS